MVASTVVVEKAATVEDAATVEAEAAALALERAPEVVAVADAALEVG